MVDSQQGPPLHNELDGHRILVVDDDRDLADTLSVILRAYGAQVYKAYSGPVAVELFDEYIPELVLLDLAMPGMTGFETAKTIHSCPNGADTPIVAITGLNKEKFLDQSAESGIQFYLIKPFRIPTLIEFLMTMLKGS